MENGLTNWLRTLVAFVCGYEVLALSTKKYPTICALHRKKKWVGPIIIGGLTLHMYAPVTPTVILSDNT